MPGPDAHENIALLPQASTLAERVDGLFLFLVGLDALMVVVLFGLIIGFAAYYRRGARRERTSHLPQTTLEITWSTALLLVFLGIFAWSARLYVEELSPPKDALEIQGIGKQWMWKFEHRGGQREINELHLPLGVPVKLILASQDVIHSFLSRPSGSSRTWCRDDCRRPGSYPAGSVATTCSAPNIAGWTIPAWGPGGGDGTAGLRGLVGRLRQRRRPGGPG